MFAQNDILFPIPKMQSLVSKFLHKARIQNCNNDGFRFVISFDWQIITAAFVTDTSVRNNMISAVLKYASNGQNNVPFGDLYDTTNGKATSFKARPAVGGHLALLSYSFSGQNTASSPKSGSSSIIVKPGVVLVTMSSLFSIMSSPWYI